MSNRYKGAVISATPPTTSTTAASGAWTLEQQMQAQAAGTWPSPPLFIEELFSTYLYTGNGSTQTITNGIDLSGQGGLVWIKSRMTYDASGTVTNHNLITDPAAGRLQSNTTAALGGSGGPGFTSTGFQVSGTVLNSATEDGTLLPNRYASWTFREQPKFFDIVTYTGDGIIGRTVAHNLGSVPGCIIVKRTNSSGTNWRVYHRSFGATYSLALNTTAAATTLGGIWADTEPTSTVFSVGDNTGVNGSGDSYVAYLFAHDAGGFPVSGGGSTNAISCGSFTSSSGAATVTLGYEPQWIMFKRSDSSTGGNWYIVDAMRGWSFTTTAELSANTSNAEDGNAFVANPTATGFSFGTGTLVASGTYIYIAIRRGPMATPTLGTNVFDVDTRAGSASIAKTNSDILTDLAVIKRYTSAAEYWAWTPRLVGNQTLQSNGSDPEITGAMATNPWDTMTGAFCAASNGATNTSTLVDYSFRRAPGFHDVVCYVGTEVVRTITHNLGVAPELLIVKRRDGYPQWRVYNAVSGTGFFMNLNGEEPVSSSGAIEYWNNTTPTASVFSLGTQSSVNGGGYTYVAYLFATCAGVSKVGGYTGTGALQTINCGFTSGARFVLIKRTDDTADWYVWDSARGITSGNDPYLILNTTAAQVTGTNYVDTDTTGFKVTAAAPAALNASGGSYIFLAIA